METKKKKTVVFAPVLEEQKKQVLVSKANVIEDLVLILNPLYDHLFSDAIFFLQEYGFGIIDKGFITFTEDQAIKVFGKRYKSSRYREDIINHFKGRK